MQSKQDVLLCGPDIRPSPKAFYGQGVGGFVRNMKVYLEVFQNEELAFRPCFNSVRRKGSFYRLLFPFRLLRDFFNFIWQSRGIRNVHILGQYRRSIYREALFVAWSGLFRKRVVYDVKGGGLAAWYPLSRRLSRWLFHWVLKRAHAVLLEGKPDIDFLISKGAAAEKLHYFPNFVPDSEVPAQRPERSIRSPLRILFVGYCYDGKGVFELADACQQAARQGLEINLTYAGAETEAFTAFIDAINPPPGLTIHREGVVTHDRILELFQQNDVFAMPSRHAGEGHTNSVNEALMMGLVVVCTRQGFLGSVLDESCAYFHKQRDVDGLVERLQQIVIDPDQALQKADHGYQRLLERFTSSRASQRLQTVYSP